MVKPRLKSYNIENGGIAYLSRKKEEEIIVQNWKKEKLKTKKLSKIRILDGQEPQYNQQTE